MFCKKCGTELRNGVSFCPRCGASLLAHPLEGVETKVVERPARKMKRKYILAVLLAFVMIVAVYNAVRIIELSIVKSEVEDQMEMVKNGPDPETMDVFVDKMIHGTIDNEGIASFLSDQISGEDALDIYRAVMRHMSYSVKDVRKIEANHYQVTIEVANLNNRIVASNTCNYFVSRYTGKGISGAILQAFEDFTSDKSQTIASLFDEVSDYVYSLNDSRYYVSGEYTIDITKVDGEWVTTFEQGLYNFLFKCAGI